MEIPFSDGIVKKVTWNRTVYYVYDRLLSGYGIDGLWLRGMVSRNQGTQQLQWLVRLSVIALPALLLLVSVRIFNILVTVKLFPIIFFLVKFNFVHI